MRRNLVVVATALLVLLVLAPAAAAIPEPKGCPAEPSGWYFTDYWTGGDWQDAGYIDEVADTGLFRVLFQLTIVGQSFMDTYGTSQAETYWIWTHGGIDAVVDRNGDDAICVDLRTSGGVIPGVPVDYYLIVVDNNANASR